MGFPEFAMWVAARKIQTPTNTCVPIVTHLFFFLLTTKLNLVLSGPIDSEFL